MNRELARRVRGHVPPIIFLNGVIWCFLACIYIKKILKKILLHKIMINCSPVLASVTVVSIIR